MKKFLSIITAVMLFLNICPIITIAEQNYSVELSDWSDNKVKFTITSAEPFQGETLIIAWYNSQGELIRHSKKILDYSNCRKMSIGVNINSASTIKAFLWDSLDGMIPLDNNSIWSSDLPTPTPTPTNSPTPTPTATPSPTPTATPSPTPFSPDDYAEEVARIVNEYRSDEGLSSLSLDSTLTAAAQERAEELTELFSHTRPDGTSCFTILTEYGVAAGVAGENIACGQTSPASVMTSWMNSEGHRANILNKSFNKIGVGVYKYNRSYYWVQIFTG